MAAYSSAPLTLEGGDLSVDAVPCRMDFKDSDMKRLSMEIERERCVWFSGCTLVLRAVPLPSANGTRAFQAGVHGEEQELAGTAEGAQVGDRVPEAGGAAAEQLVCPPHGPPPLLRAAIQPPQQCNYSCVTLTLE